MSTPSNEPPEPTEADWKRMQSLVLQRLEWKYDPKRMSERLRNTPTIQIQDPETMESILLSPSEVIAEVKSLSHLGKHYILATMKLLQELQP